MRKCHNCHAILHKLYTWFGKNQLRLYLNEAKNVSIGGGCGPSSKYAHAYHYGCHIPKLKYGRFFHSLPRHFSFMPGFEHYVSVAGSRKP